jgi:MIP family channel proteins
MNYRAMVAEFVGTFALVWVGILAIEHMKGDLLGIAFAHGLAIAILATATGAVSGGHLNPAVTLGFLMARKIKTADAFGYIVSQLAAGVLASLLVMNTMVDAGSEVVKQGTPAVAATVNSGVVAWSFEVVATFFLMFAILGTAVDRRAPKMGGLYIGLAVTMGILAIGPLTGAAMNPARWFGPATIGGSPVTMAEIVVYVLGPVAGAILATIVYQLFLMPKEQVAETA